MGAHLWVLLFVVGVSCGNTNGGGGGVTQGVALVNVRRAVGITDEDYVCATLDWWPPEKCDYGACSWGMASLLNLNLSSPILLNAVKAFSPLRLRLGGTLQDKVMYHMGKLNQSCTEFVRNSSAMFGFTQGCLSTMRWDELNRFFRKSRATAIFGLNALNGRVPLPDGSLGGSWNSSNAASLIRYTANKGYHVHGWELGNELSGRGIGARIAADQYAADVIKLKNIVDDIYRAFPVKPLILAPGGFFDAVWYEKLINRTRPNFLDAITHHIYNLGPGVENHLVEKILNPSYLDGESRTFGNFQRMLRRTRTKAVAWVSEAGGAYNSGRNLVTNTFIFSFWYLDQLGMAASYDTKTYCRQSLIGGNYGLLNTTTYLPNPSYYSALLWHKLMGKNALLTNFTGAKNIRAYAHCSKGSKGITMLLINLNANTTVHVTTKPLHPKHHRRNTNREFLQASAPRRITGGSIRKEYHLTAENGNLQSQKVLLNGRVLVVDKHGKIPVLVPVTTKASKPIVLSPFSIAFAHIPNIYQPVCK